MKKGNQIYYIAEKPLAENHAGNKARLDIDRMLERKGYSPLEYFEFVTFPSFAKKLMYRASPRYLKKIGKLCRTKGEKIILQYPFFGDVFTQRAFKRLVRNNRVILVVHDVDALRDFGETKLSHELEVFQCTKCLIVHNASMKQALQKLNIKVPMVELEVFDYLLDGELPAVDASVGSSVSFAGNFQKSDFWKKSSIADLGTHFHLYGPNFAAEQIPWDNVTYEGSYRPDIIPYKLNGHFGLIWDGPATDTCRGAFGEYMKYNNPHKLSLYLAAGKPVIIWKEAAATEFVEKYKVGFSVASLPEMAERLSDLKEESYQAYIAGVESLRKKICSGFYFNNALQKALAFVE